MKTWDILPKILLGFALLTGFTIDGTSGWAESFIRIGPVAEEGSVNREIDQTILVEIFLSPEHKKDLDKIKKAFEAVSITRLRAQFFRAGNPPENIAIGSNVSAPIARLAIHLAITYNRGVKYLLPEYRYFPDHIAIGTSAFDEASQIPIRLEDLDRLSDPSLNTEQFHELYRHFTGEDKHLPTYLP
jgi:hypothetical protein